MTQKKKQTEYAYHVTYASNIKQIKSEGIVPKKGPRSLNFGEDENLIYLFTNVEGAEDAVMNWLGDELDDETETLALLRVNIGPYKEHCKSSENSFEITCSVAISPAVIQVITEDF